MIQEILRELGPSCRDERRRALIIENPQLGLNGIDFVEYRQVPPVGPNDEPSHFLDIHFLRPVAAGGFGLDAELELIRIEGGTRIPSIRPLEGIQVGADPMVLTVPVAQQGDFSTYWLSLGWRTTPQGASRFELTGVDRQFSVASAFFRADCPVDFDCAPEDECEPDQLEEPHLDYLAKDYASFRQLLLDLLAERHPEWLERNPADLGMALLELFAYEGDQISYLQDAVANEAYLETARRRVSAKRHARLVDYAMHDGRNAWTYVHAAVTKDGAIPVGQPLLTRIDVPLRGENEPPGVIITNLDANDFDTDPALGPVQVYETATALRAAVVNNEIRIHSWGAEECCLPVGTTVAHLFSVTPGPPREAVRPQIVPGDLLLFEEIRSAAGVAAEADPAHGWVVRVTEVDATVEDYVLSKRFTATGAFKPSSGTTDRLPLLEVHWELAQALPFALCLGARDREGELHSDLAVARGNLALADHGQTVSETYELSGPLEADARFRLTLERRPLTIQCGSAEYDRVARKWSGERPDLSCDVRAARPALALVVTDATGESVWRPVPDLLDSDAFAQEFVADLERGGSATVRFGDGEYGREPIGAREIRAVYRIGNGRMGEVGAESLAHVAPPRFTSLTAWPTIAALRNPLPSQGGVDPETLEEVRQYAPAAFRARQFRAVTTADYVDAAREVPGVAGAAAGFRWTGSWYTALVAVDPHDDEDLIREPGGRTRLSDGLERRVRAQLARYRLAGYDLEIRSARYVPLRIELDICALPGHFAADVAHAVEEALRPGRSGRRALFDPAHLTFGQAVHLSRVYSAVDEVEGVESARVTIFQRQDRAAAGELEAGVLPIGPWEIARLEDDPSRMEYGVLTVTGRGLK
jgi:hypothetical protein